MPLSFNCSSACVLDGAVAGSGRSPQTLVLPQPRAGHTAVLGQEQRAVQWQGQKCHTGAWESACLGACLFPVAMLEAAPELEKWSV